MKTNIKSFLFIGILVLLIILVYGIGFYRGYQDRSRISSSFELACNEAVYEEIQANEINRAKSSLQVIIFGESENLKTMERYSFGNFANEFPTANSGNISKEIQKADELTKGLTFRPFQVPEGK